MDAFKEQVLKDQQFQAFWTQSLAFIGQQPLPPQSLQQQVHQKTDEREDVSVAPSTPARSTTHDMVKTEDDGSLWEPDEGNTPGTVFFDEWAMPAAEEEKQRKQDEQQQHDDHHHHQQDAPSQDADADLLPPNTPPPHSSPSTADCVEADAPTPATDPRSYKRHGVDGEEGQTGAKRAKTDGVEALKDAVKGQIIAMRFNRDNQRLTRAFLALVKPKMWVLELLECALRHGATVATGVNIVVDVANTLPHDKDEWTAAE